MNISQKQLAPLLYVSKAIIEVTKNPDVINRLFARYTSLEEAAKMLRDAEAKIAEAQKTRESNLTISEANKVQTNDLSLREAAYAGRLRELEAKEAKVHADQAARTRDLRERDAKLKEETIALTSQSEEIARLKVDLAEAAGTIKQLTTHIELADAKKIKKRPVGHPGKPPSTTDEEN